MSKVLAGDPHFIRALLAFVAGEVACDKDIEVSGGTDLVSCKAQATTMVVSIAGALTPPAHVHYYLACDDHAPELIGAVHADRGGLFFEVGRTDHDDSCQLIEVEHEHEDG